MKEPEYCIRRIDIEIEFAEKFKSLDNEYALSNNEVEIGDVISSCDQTIIVDKISVGKYLSRPCCKYYGYNGDGTRGIIWQSYVIDIKKGGK